MQVDEYGYPIPYKTIALTENSCGDRTTYMYAVFKTCDIWEILREHNFSFETKSEFTSDQANEVVASLCGMRTFSRGPGRAFGSVPFLRINKRLTIVRQYIALDI
jgi:hypothetical protein